MNKNKYTLTGLKKLYKLAVKGVRQESDYDEYKIDKKMFGIYLSVMKAIENDCFENGLTYGEARLHTYSIADVFIIKNPVIYNKLKTIYETKFNSSRSTIGTLIKFARIYDKKKAYKIYKEHTKTVPLSYAFLSDSD